MAVAALLPAVGLLVYNEFAGRQQRTKEVHSEAARASVQAASEIERVLEGTRSLLIAVSAIPAINQLRAEGCTETLAGVTSKIAHTGAILLVGMDGKLVCDSQGHAPGTDFSDRPYIRDALRARDAVIGNYTVSRLTGNAVLPVAIPILQGGKTVGVLGTGIRLDWLQENLTAKSLGIGSAVTIADRNGTIMARIPYPERFVGTSIPDKFLHLLRAKSADTIKLVSQDGTERILGYQPLTATRPLYVSAGMSTKEAFDEVNRTTWTGIAALVISILTAIFASHWVGDRFILTPITHILKTLDRRRAGETTARTGMGGDFELDTVGQSLDSLLDQIDQQQRALEQTDQKRALLARELSHRVKNTLTIIAAVARKTFKNQPEAMMTFNRRIQALGGAYDVLLASEVQMTDLKAVIITALKPYGVEILERCNVSGAPVTLNAEQALGLSLVVHELTTNAIKYGALSNNSGRVMVDWQIDGPIISLSWRELGGPSVVQPLKEGFGSQLIRNALPGHLRTSVEIQYLPQGLAFKVTFASCRDADTHDAKEL